MDSSSYSSSSLSSSSPLRLRLIDLRRLRRLPLLSWISYPSEHRRMFFSGCYLQPFYKEVSSLFYYLILFLQFVTDFLISYFVHNIILLHSKILLLPSKCYFYLLSSVPTLHLHKGVLVLPYRCSVTLSPSFFLKDYSASRPTLPSTLVILRT